MSQIRVDLLQVQFDTQLLFVTFPKPTAWRVLAKRHKKVHSCVRQEEIRHQEEVVERARNVDIKTLPAVKCRAIADAWESLVSIIAGPVGVQYRLSICKACPAGVASSLDLRKTTFFSSTGH